MVGAHWLDPAPGQGRTARAWAIAEAVGLEQIAEAGTYAFDRLVELVVLDGDACETVAWMVRVSIARRAIRIQAFLARETCREILASISY